MTLGAESFWSGSHIIIIIQNFTLISMISSVTLQSVGLPFGAAVLSLLIYLSFYIRDSLHTCLPMHWSHRYVYIPIGRRFRLGTYLRLSTCRGMQFVILDHCNMRQGSWAVGWMQLTLFLCVVVNLVISIG